MGTEAIWIPLVTAAIGAGASAYQAKKVGDRQDSIAAAGIRNQVENQRRVNERLNRTLTDTAAVDANAPRAANDASYLQAIQRQLANGTAGLTRRGVSDQYDQLATGAAGDASDYAGTVAGLLSRIDAGTQLRQNERTIASDFGYDVAPIGGDIQGDEFLTRLRMGGVRRNPYVDLLAGAAQGVGNAYSARGA
jgi:hypothetical protein